MPDRYGFNPLGDTVRYQLPHWRTARPLAEGKRATHARAHHDAFPRPRNLAAAAATRDPNEKKEATAMATSSPGESAKQVAIDTLRQAATPLPAKEIAKQILPSGRCARLKGKTPEATISAMLAVGTNPAAPSSASATEHTPSLTPMPNAAT